MKPQAVHPGPGFCSHSVSGRQSGQQRLLRGGETLSNIKAWPTWTQDERELEGALEFLETEACPGVAVWGPPVT